MKKILFSFLTLSLLTSFSLASCPICNQDECSCKKNTQCEKNYNKCDKYDMLDDDEYCTYNQCYFDKRYKKMKTTLCLSQKQECQIDSIYKNFKHDMDNLHLRFRTEKNKLLEMIACDNDCWKDQKKTVKTIGKEAKQKCKCFKEDVKEQLCKNQYSAFRKYGRQEKRKIKKLCKYGKIVKLPCVDCCGK